MADLTEAVRRDAPYSFAVASDLLLMVQNTTDVHFSSIGILMISAFVEVLHRPGNKLPVQAFIICHGYATASSIADVCNKMLHKYLFNAIDMPYDVPVSEIVSQVKKILYFNENRDVLILVDLGSLENITELLDDLPNVNLGSSTMFPQRWHFRWAAIFWTGCRWQRFWKMPKMLRRSAIRSWKKPAKRM